MSKFVLVIYVVSSSGIMILSSKVLCIVVVSLACGFVHCLAGSHFPSDFVSVLFVVFVKCKN